MSPPDSEPIPGILPQIWRALGPQERVRLRDLYMSEMNLDPVFGEQRMHDFGRDGPQGDPYPLRRQLSNAGGNTEPPRQQ